jgi:hypothetical protein
VRVSISFARKRPAAFGFMHARRLIGKSQADHVINPIVERPLVRRKATVSRVAQQDQSARPIGIARHSSPRYQAPKQTKRLATRAAMRQSNGCSTPLPGRDTATEIEDDHQEERCRTSMKQRAVPSEQRES